MPTYDYRCEKCGAIFEIFQSIRDEPFSVCQECRGALVRLVGGGSGVIFKGRGFYVNDSKKSDKTSASTSSKTETPKPQKEAS